jgi:hypothetical protein
MARGSASRRSFLKLAGAGVAGTALSAAASSYARIAGANDRVGVGIVGFSDRFKNSLAPAFMKSAGELNGQSGAKTAARLSQSCPAAGKSRSLETTKNSTRTKTCRR